MFPKNISVPTVTDQVLNKDYTDSFQLNMLKQKV